MSGLNYPVQLAGSFSALSLNSEPKSAIKLASNNKERELNDNYAEVYSIIKTVEYLEKAYFRNACTAEELIYIFLAIIFPFIYLLFQKIHPSLQRFNCTIQNSTQIHS